MENATAEFYKNLPQTRARLALLADEDNIPDGVIQGEVPGFPGLVFLSNAVDPNLSFTVGPWDDMSTDPANPDKLTVWMLNSETDDPDTQIPLQPMMDVVSPPDMVSINIPLFRRQEGIYWLIYEVFVAATFNTSRSLPQPFVIDKTAPYTGFRGAIPAPVRPADMPASVGKDYFDSNGGIALFTVPDYVAYGKAPGDWILLYINGSRTPLQLVPPDASNPLDPPQKWVLPADLSVPLSWDVLEAHLPSGGGPFTIYYEMFDAAGNAARPSSESLRVTVSNVPDPTLLLPPTIDRAVPGDNLVDRNDTALDNGMLVRIPPYTNFVPGIAGDRAVVTIAVGTNSLQLPAVTLGSAPFPPIQVTLGQLLQVYDVAESAVQMTVSYVIERGSNTFPLPPAPAPSTTVNLDLFFPAGPAPTDPPDLVNRDLLAPHIYGQKDDGTYEPTGGPNEDKLTRDHANRQAQARVTLWSKPPLPGVRDFDITLFYAGKRVSSTRVTGGIAGQVVEIPVPWSLIQVEGNGDKSLEYRVSATGTNFQISPETLFNVQANFKFLAAPTVRRLAGASATSQGAVNCDSFLPKAPPGVLTVYVPPSEFFVRGERITVTIKGYSDNAGTIEIPAAAASEMTAEYDPITFRNGVEVTFSNHLTLLKLLQADSSRRSVGSLRVYYETRLEPEGNTKSDEATPASRVIRVGTGGYFYCDGIVAPLP